MLMTIISNKACNMLPLANDERLKQCRGAKFATPKCTLGREDSFRLNLFKNLKTWSFSCYSPSTAAKNVDKGPVPIIDPWPTISTEHGRGVLGETQHPVEIRVHSAPSKLLFTKHLLIWLLPHWNPNILFCLSSRWYLRWGLRPFWWVSASGSLPCICVTKLLLDFLLLICLLSI